MEMTMTDVHTNRTASGERADLHRFREPRFTPLDIMAYGVGTLMMLGPLAAAALFN
jgi:hypothetical protein